MTDIVSNHPCSDNAIPSSITTTHTLKDNVVDEPEDEDEDLDDDEMSLRLRREALAALEEEPELSMLLYNTVLAPGVKTFEEAVATTVTYRLLLRPCHDTPTMQKQQQQQQQQQHTSSSSSYPMMFCPNSLRGILAHALHRSNIPEAGHTMAEAVRQDALAYIDRDPAVDSLLEVVLFLKGFAALVCHRAAYYKWHESKNIKTNTVMRKSMTALWLQSQASAVFGMDIHPAAQMGAGIVLDHGTGIVIGETATVGDNCTLLHGVTLGGTGKDHGDRHPKVGHHVLIGANASLLGNITIGHGAKIGAGSIVLGPIPSGATAVGAPAKIIGRAKESEPSMTMDENLHSVSRLHKSQSSATMITSSTASMSSSSLTGISSTIQEGIISEETHNNGTKHAIGTTTNNNKASELDTASETDALSNDSNCCCPFRDYVILAKSAPKNCITICTLRCMLGPEGCTKSEIGEILFHLDIRDVGYVHPEDFFTDATTALIHEKTTLTKERCEQIMTTFRNEWSRKHKISQKQGPTGITRPMIVAESVVE